jgi:radical SAM superfamily enzyme YgiQ (UPF0313 family)
MMMHKIPFELGPIRPVAEAQSLIIRVTRGCPWTQCEFCTHYRDINFSIRPIDDIKRDILRARQYYIGKVFESCFLQDGDSFIMKTKDLLEVLKCLKKHFPDLKRVTSYGRAKSIARKNITEMIEIKKAGLNRLYCGMESGSNSVLKEVKKGATAKDLIKAGQMAKEAGIEISEFIILGLGGRALWEKHALKTAKVLNQINPDYIRIRTIIVKDGSILKNRMKDGDYRLQSEEEYVFEQRLLLENLKNIDSFYLNDHSMNLMTEVEGKLPEDKAKMLSLLDGFLTMSKEDKLNYIIGKRLGYYRRIEDLKDAFVKKTVKQQIDLLHYEDFDRLPKIFNQLRKQYV